MSSGSSRLKSGFYHFAVLEFRSPTTTSWQREHHEDNKTQFHTISEDGHESIKDSFLLRLIVHVPRVICNRDVLCTKSGVALDSSSFRDSCHSTTFAARSPYALNFYL